MMEAIDGRLQRELLRLEVPWPGFDVVPECPVVRQPVSDALEHKRTCDEINHQNHRLPMTLLARLKNENNEVDVNTLIKEGEVHKYVRLECDAKCLQMERNRSLADALGIAAKPEAVTALPEVAYKYSESLKQAYMHYPDFVRETYTTLSQLVKGAEKSRNNFSFHHFQSMRQDLRAIVHELAEVFKCRSHSEGEAPHSNVVVKAVKDKSCIPPLSVMDVMKNRVTGKSGSNFTTLVKNSSVPAAVAPAAKAESKPAAAAVVSKDYFDFDGNE